MKRLEVEKELVLTKAQLNAVAIFDYIASKYANIPYSDRAQNAVNFVATFMTRKRIETVAQAIAKRSIQAILTALQKEFPDEKELDVSFRWLQTSFLVMCGKVRIQYETPVMDLFYWNRNLRDIFKNAFIKQAISIMGDCTFEAPQDIWASVWHCTITNE